jgi:hypothetical protein
VYSQNSPLLSVIPLSVTIITHSKKKKKREKREPNQEHYGGWQNVHGGGKKLPVDAMRRNTCPVLSINQG